MSSHSLSSVPICVLIFSPYAPVSHTGSGPAHLTSLHHNNLVVEAQHLRYLALGLPHMNFGSHGLPHSKVLAGITRVESHSVAVISWTHFFFFLVALVELPGGLVLRPSWLAVSHPSLGQLLECLAVCGQPCPAC